MRSKALKTIKRILISAAFIYIVFFGFNLLSNNVDVIINYILNRNGLSYEALHEEKVEIEQLTMADDENTAIEQSDMNENEENVVVEKPSGAGGERNVNSEPPSGIDDENIVIEPPSRIDEENNVIEPPSGTDEENNVIEPQGGSDDEIIAGNIIIEQPGKAENIDKQNSEQSGRVEDNGNRNNERPTKGKDKGNANNEPPSQVEDDDKVNDGQPPQVEDEDKANDGQPPQTENEQTPLAPETYLAKDAGMVPNDKGKAVHNANQLIKALNRNNRIIIDNSYYIATPYEVLTAKAIEITGNGNAELIAANDKNACLFDPASLSSLTIRDVRFKNSNNNAFLIAYNANKIGTKVSRFDVQGCTFQGNISLYRHCGNTSLDPDKEDYGVGELIFKDNKVSNTRLTFITLQDVPVKHCEISNNVIQNFQYRFCSISITNDIPYENKLYEHIKYLEAENNNVICDDKWWGETSSGVYYTFVLFEGNEVLYNNNHVEGMKTHNDFAVYDAYLSARIVNYTNNTWKNNICFASNKIHNTLLKSKSGGVKPLIRNYSNNRFIVDESFASRNGQKKENLYVYFISLNNYADSYRITDNLFDVYDLRFSESSMCIGDLTICGNTFKAGRASGNLAILGMDKNNEVKSVNISDNTIEIGSGTNNGLNLIKVVDNSKSAADSIKSISVKNNNITAPIGYIFYDTSAGDLEFKNNTIENTGGKSPGFAYRGKFDKTDINNNKIESRGSDTFLEGRQLYGAGTKKETLNIVRNNSVSGNDGLHLDLSYNSKAPTTYKRTYTFDTKAGTFRFSYTFTLIYNNESGCAEVTFNNSKGETNTYRLGIDNSAVSGNGQYIELINLGENEIEGAYKVCFSNSSDKACFYIADYDCDFCEIKIETISS